MIKFKFNILSNAKADINPLSPSEKLINIKQNSRSEYQSCSNIQTDDGECKFSALLYTHFILNIVI